jgi:hypothetical protein
MMMADATVVSTEQLSREPINRGRSGWEAATPLAGVLESKPALPSREEDTDAAFAATACCNAIPDAIAC